MSKLIVLMVFYIGAGLYMLAIRALHQVAMQRQLLGHQRKRVKNLRLNKMLAYLGVDQGVYLRKVPNSMIEQQIYRCSQCTNTEICDDCLLDRRDVNDMHFCPNYTSLLAQSRHLCKT